MNQLIEKYINDHFDLVIRGLSSLTIIDKIKNLEISPLTLVNEVASVFSINHVEINLIFQIWLTNKPKILLKF